MNSDAAVPGLDRSAALNLTLITSFAQKNRKNTVKL